MAITFKKLSGDTEVIANPTLDGSETALSGLQIDGVKYAMGGGKLYEHNIRIARNWGGDPSIEAYVTIINASSEPFTTESLANFLYAADNSSDKNFHTATGEYKNGDQTYRIMSIFAMTQNDVAFKHTLGFAGVNLNFNWKGDTVDIVKEI